MQMPKIRHEHSQCLNILWKHSQTRGALSLQSSWLSREKGSWMQSNFKAAEGYTQLTTHSSRAVLSKLPPKGDLEHNQTTNRSFSTVLHTIRSDSLFSPAAWVEDDEQQRAALFTKKLHLQKSLLSSRHESPYKGYYNRYNSHEKK